MAHRLGGGSSDGAESDAAAAKSEADQEVCGAWWVQEHARGASRSTGAQQRLTPPLLQCAKCKAAAYCSKECKVPPPPNTHMQRAVPEPSQPAQEPQDGRSMRTAMDESIIIMLLLVTRSGTHRQPRLALMHTPDNGFILKLNGIF
jgi:hypothetical protein